MFAPGGSSDGLTGLSAGDEAGQLGSGSLQPGARRFGSCRNRIKFPETPTCLFEAIAMVRRLGYAKPMVKRKGDPKRESPQLHVALLGKCAISIRKKEKRWSQERKVRG